MKKTYELLEGFVHDVSVAASSIDLGPQSASKVDRKCSTCFLQVDVTSSGLLLLLSAPCPSLSPDFAGSERCLPSNALWPFSRSRLV